MKLVEYPFVEKGRICRDVRVYMCALTEGCRPVLKSIERVDAESNTNWNGRGEKNGKEEREPVSIAKSLSNRDRDPFREHTLPGCIRTLRTHG